MIKKKKTVARGGWGDSIQPHPPPFLITHQRHRVHARQLAQAARIGGELALGAFFGHRAFVFFEEWGQRRGGGTVRACVQGLAGGLCARRQGGKAGATAFSFDRDVIFLHFSVAQNFNPSEHGGSQQRAPNEQKEKHGPLSLSLSLSISLSLRHRS